MNGHPREVTLAGYVGDHANLLEQWRRDAGHSKVSHALHAGLVKEDEDQPSTTKRTKGSGDRPPSAIQRARAAGAAKAQAEER